MKKLTSLQYGDVIEISLADICQDSHWHTRQEVESVKPSPCMYTGYFLNRDEDCIRCFNLVCCSDSDCDVSIFPLGVIKGPILLKRSKNGGNSNA